MNVPTGNTARLRLEWWPPSNWNPWPGSSESAKGPGEVLAIPLGKYIGKRLGGLPNNEGEHGINRNNRRPV
jgi:hypothetical protein